MIITSIYGILTKEYLQYLVFLEEMMKKLVYSGAGILFILSIMFFSSRPDNYVNAESEITEFEYEYYYNDDNSEDAYMNTANTLNSSNDNKKNKHSKDYLDYNSISLDTDPDSISVFVNKEYTLPESYVPDNLVVPEVNFFGNNSNGKNMLRKEAADALEKMFNDASEEGISLYGVSGYRSYARQKQIYEKNVRLRGSKSTNKVSASPGHSEHQTGLAIDISSKSLGDNLTKEFANTPEGKWVAKNCYQYGFIVRYPKGAEKITGYSYEPWHIRYVGTELSEYIYNEDITLEEYFGYSLDEYYLDSIVSD